MLILPGVEAAEILLDYFGLFVEELALLLLHFILLLICKLATADIASPDLLDLLSGLLFILVVLPDFIPTNVLLDDSGGGIFFVSKFFCFINHAIV